MTNALSLFQESNNLPLTNGTLDDATLQLMNEPRCGLSDTFQPFTANRDRMWKNFTITWYAYGELSRHRSVLERAFAKWSEHTNLIFKRSIDNPKILLNMGKRTHMKSKEVAEECPYPFDGPSHVLAHAEYPNQWQTPVEIHFDADENWHYSSIENSSSCPSNKTSFLWVAVHEIGHALGLEHSLKNGSIMNPWYRSASIHLSDDDINGIQFLYGNADTGGGGGVTSKIATTKMTSTSTATRPKTTTAAALPVVTTPTTPTTTATYVTEPLPVNTDVCNYRKVIHTFFVVKDKIFIFYGKYVWVIDLNEKTRDEEQLTRPQIVTQWLKFLPYHFKKIDGIYQNSNDEIVLFSDTLIYTFTYPELSLINIKTLSTLPRASSVDAVVKTYNGKTYIISNFYIYKIDDCSTTTRFLGYHRNIFTGLPASLKGAFRYINGKIYFFDNANLVYEYDDFFEAITASKLNMFDILNIHCTDHTILSRLYDLVSQLIATRSHRLIILPDDDDETRLEEQKEEGEEQD